MVSYQVLMKNENTSQLRSEIERSTVYGYILNAAFFAIFDNNIELIKSLCKGGYNLVELLRINDKMDFFVGLACNHNRLDILRLVFGEEQSLQFQNINPICLHIAKTKGFESIALFLKTNGLRDSPCLDIDSKLSTILTSIQNIDSRVKALEENSGKSKPKFPQQLPQPEEPARLIKLEKRYDVEVTSLTDFQTFNDFEG